jgi:hypothetical protein
MGKKIIELMIEESRLELEDLTNRNKVLVDRVNYLNNLLKIIEYEEYNIKSVVFPEGEELVKVRQLHKIVI